MIHAKTCLLSGGSLKPVQYGLRRPRSSSGYSIIKKIPIPGNGSWDYLAVDEGGRRLYVSHGTQVEVIDLDS